MNPGALAIDLHHRDPTLRQHRLEWVDWDSPPYFAKRNKSVG